jgi:hypothetical protein
MIPSIPRDRYRANQDALRQAIRLTDAAYTAPSEYMCLAGCHQALWLALKVASELDGVAMTDDDGLAAALDAFLERNPPLTRNPNLIQMAGLRRIPAAIAHHRTHPGLDQTGYPPMDRDALCRDIHRWVHNIRRQLAGRRPFNPRAWLGGSLAALVMLGLLAWQNLWPQAGRTQGVQVTYFSDINLEHPRSRRVQQALAVDYGTGVPALGVSSDHYSSRWVGFLHVPETTNYAFFVQSEDGLRLWMDDQLLVDNWRDQKWESSGRHAQIRLSAGYHRLRLEHYKRQGRGVLRVKWSGGPVPDNTDVAAPYLWLRAPADDRQSIP